MSSFTNPADQKHGKWELPGEWETIRIMMLALCLDREIAVFAESQSDFPVQTVTTKIDPLRLTRGWRGSPHCQ